MRNLFQTVIDVLTPGAPHFKETLQACEKREETFRKHLQMLEQPVTREILGVTDDVAEFKRHD